MELVTCVGSISALLAAAAAGADMVRAGLSGYCRAGSRSLTEEEFSQAANYCLPRGVRICASLDRPVAAERFPSAVDTAVRLAAAGVSAFCVGDLGLLRALQIRIPDIPLFLSDSLGIHDLAGAAVADKYLGAARLLLPPQVSREGLKRILPTNPKEIEVQVFGFACVNCGMTCRLGSFSLRGGDSASLCTRPCLESFGYASRPDGFRPAMKTIYLGDHLQELESMGVAAVTVMADDKTGACAAAVTNLFYRLLHDRKPPAPEEIVRLLRQYAPEGVSDACYLGKPEEALLGYDQPVRARRVSVRVSKETAEELQRVPVTMTAVLRRGLPLQLRAEDREGRSAVLSGSIPETARSDRRELTEALLRTQLYNTLGTPFYCAAAKVSAEPGLSLSSLEVSRLRKAVLDRLLELRKEPPALHTAPLPPLLRCDSPYREPELSISVRKAVQLTPELAVLKPLYLYVPLEVLEEAPARITPFWENGHTRICAVLPPLIPDAETSKTYDRLKAMRELQIGDVMIHSVGQMLGANLLGFKVHCGVGVDVANDWTLRVLEHCGAVSAVVSPELSLTQIGQLAKCVDTELYAYGRIPLLSTETCLIKAAGGGCDCHKACSLLDRNGRQYPLQRTGGCHNILYSPDKLFLGDRLKDLRDLGVRCLHLAFTTENSRECVTVAQRYLGLNTFVPNARTKGYYEENKAGPGLRFSKKAGPSGNAGSV